MSDASSAAWRLFQCTAHAIGHFFNRYDIGHFRPTATEALTLHVINQLNAGWLLRALDIAGPMAAKLFDFRPYTPLFNLTGQPAMPVPFHWSAGGLPISMQFIARYGDATMINRRQRSAI